MILTIILTVISTLVIQFIGFGCYLLITKNNKLTKVIQYQQQQLDSISYLISEAQQKIEEADAKGTFRSDDELGYFWTQIKEIYLILKEAT